MGLFKYIRERLNRHKVNPLNISGHEPVTSAASHRRPSGPAYTWSPEQLRREAEIQLYGGPRS